MPEVRLMLRLLPALLVAATAMAGELPDPTRPPQQQGGAPAEAPVGAPLTLDFVISSRDRHLARINGQWVSEGDVVAGARVERIEGDRVVVRRDGRPTVLRPGGGGMLKKKTER